MGHAKQKAQVRFHMYPTHDGFTSRKLTETAREKPPNGVDYCREHGNGLGELHMEFRGGGDETPPPHTRTLAVGSQQWLRSRNGLWFLKLRV